MKYERIKVAYEGDLATPMPKTTDVDSFTREWKRRFDMLYQIFRIDPADPNADRRLALGRVDTYRIHRTMAARVTTAR
jgi:hypothetical protein